MIRSPDDGRITDIEGDVQMKTTTKAALSVAAAAAVALPAAVFAPSPASAVPNDNVWQTCNPGSSWSYARGYNESGLGYPDSPRQSWAGTENIGGNACGSQIFYSVKIKVKTGPATYSYHASSWAPAGQYVELLGSGPIMASCHGWRSSPSVPWHYEYLDADATNTHGTTDCDDAGIW
jgi:hypothetical protein